MKVRKRRAEVLRNRILMGLALLVVALVVAIVVTRPKAEKPQGGGEDTSSATQSDVVPAPETESSTSGVPSTSSVPSEPGTSGETSASSTPSSSDTPSSTPTSVEAADPYYVAAMPLLVNPTNKIPGDYKPDVVAMGNGYNYDKTANVAFQAMNKKAKAEGIALQVVSAYRTVEKQTTNFNAKVKEFENNGYDAQAAYAATAQIIAVPGTSEHTLGLALDLNSLETSFEDTAAFRWLIKNCADFGFILRYPKDKVDITDITYEPWHYRYVGSNHAKIIMEKGICLEEYLSGTY